jgi:acetyl-CoA carboxylase biotin carboxyl carrier protein
MRIDSLQQLSTWLDDAGIGLLELHGPGMLLRLGRDAVDAAAMGERGAAVPHQEQDSQPRGVTVNAPSAGVFLHSHPMQSAPLAPVGAQVRAGAPMSLLQIGALLLPVCAPQAAIVTGLRVPHGTVVGYGTPLVDLDPD